MPPRTHDSARARLKIGLLVLLMSILGLDASLSFGGVIQQRIEAAKPGDTIHVSEGVFIEKLTVAMDITLVGSGRGATAVEAQGLGTVVTIQAGATVTLRDMTFRGGQSGVVNSGDLVLERCEISGSGPDYVGGVPNGGIMNKGRMRLMDCDITGNRIAGLLRPEELA